MSALKQPLIISIIIYYFLLSGIVNIGIALNSAYDVYLEYGQISFAFARVVGVLTSVVPVFVCLYYINQQYSITRRVYARYGLLIIEVIGLLFLINRGHSDFFITIKALDVFLIAMSYSSISAKEWFSIANPEVGSIPAEMNEPYEDTLPPISQKTDIQDDVETRLDSDAQVNLGLMYANGQGVAQDDSKAFYWFHKAADQGHATALFNLGVMYANGRGVAQDDSKAFYWLHKAADKGDATALFNLGVMYANGQGVAQDYSKALYWLEKASEQGESDAQYAIGMMYARGDGCEEDIEKALYWFNQASDQGHIKANELLNSKITPTEEAVATVLKVRQFLANEGDAESQFMFGVMYANGEGIEQDYKQACYWFQQSAAQGFADAQCLLGMMYAAGSSRGVEQDYSKAVYWWEKASEQGHAQAQDNLNLLNN
jgi:TPR repeat protein